MTDKKTTQTLLVSDRELDLLKVVFADNDDLLRLVRNLFFGLELTKAEKDLIVSTFKNDDIRQLMSKRFLPEIGKDVPIGQTVDLWTGIDVKGKFRDEIYQVVMARESLIQMTRKALSLLENPDAEKVSLDYTSERVGTVDSLATDLLARNNFIGHIEVQLVMIKVIAGQKTESVEGAKKRLEKDSSK